MPNSIRTGLLTVSPSAGVMKNTLAPPGEGLRGKLAASGELGSAASADGCSAGSREQATRSTAAHNRVMGRCRELLSMVVSGWEERVQ